MREPPCNVIIGIAGSGSSRIPLVGNGGARPPTRTVRGNISPLIANSELTTDARSIAIVVTRRAGCQCCVLVVECFRSRAILLKPLNATLVGNGGGSKESVSESDGDELEVNGRHLSKMLRSIKRDGGCGIGRANGRIKNGRKQQHFILEPRLQGRLS